MAPKKGAGRPKKTTTTAVAAAKSPAKSPKTKAALKSPKVTSPTAKSPKAAKSPRAAEPAAQDPEAVIENGGGGDAAEVESPVAKRGRGAKKATPAKSSAATAKSPKVKAVAAAGKGRGRPKKDAAPAAEPEAEEEETSPAPVKGKKRGAKKDEPLEGEPSVKSPKQSAEATEKPAGRGRGRKPAAEANGAKPVAAAKKGGRGKKTTEVPLDEVVENGAAEEAKPKKEVKVTKARAKKEIDEKSDAKPKSRAKKEIKDEIEENAKPKSRAKKEIKVENGEKSETKPKSRGKKEIKDEIENGDDNANVKQAQIKNEETEIDGAGPSKKVDRKRKVSEDTTVEAEVKDENVTKRRKLPKEESVEPEMKPIKQKPTTNYSALDFGVPGGKESNFKISSWNVAGLRAWVEKQGLEFLAHEQPDILCLQETKCTEDLLPPQTKVKGYHTYWLCKPGGQGGVALYTKTMPYDVKYGIGDAEQDNDSRIITAEYSKFYLINVYVPNAGRKLVNLEKRLRWDKIFQDYVKQLDAKKPVIVCGDMNVSHAEIDLARPKTNKRNAGFTQEERDGMTQLLALGFVDTFRALYPDKEEAYTFWTYMMNARAKNIGWRLDYFIVSERIQSKVVDNVMRSDVFGSDHCPLSLFLNF